jgi:hypothetical protein
MIFDITQDFAFWFNRPWHFCKLSNSKVCESPSS